MEDGFSMHLLCFMQFQCLCDSIAKIKNVLAANPVLSPEVHSKSCLHVINSNEDMVVGKGN